MSAETVAAQLIENSEELRQSYVGILESLVECEPTLKLTSSPLEMANTVVRENAGSEPETTIVRNAFTVRHRRAELAKQHRFAPAGVSATGAALNWDEAMILYRQPISDLELGWFNLGIIK